jgi:hypothetical protein
MRKSFGVFGFAVKAKEYDKELSKAGYSKYSVASLGIIRNCWKDVCWCCVFVKQLLS